MSAFGEGMIRSAGIACLMVIMLVVGSLAEQAGVAPLQVGDAEGLFIVNVPDASQPPGNILRFQSVDNWCAPLAAANALVFLDQAEMEWAHSVSGGLAPLLVSEYLGYFMATNGEGSRARENAQRRLSGTLLKDISAGVSEFVRWDRDKLYDTPPPELIEKSGVDWRVELAEGTVMDEPLAFFLGSIEAGIPPVVCFSYWNPVVVEKEELAVGDENVLVYFASWGDRIASTGVLHKADPKVPAEVWDEKQAIGHAVTGVGFIKGDPDGDRGPLPNTFWAIVHDNWAATPENIAIPWDHVAGVVVYVPR